MLFNLLKQNFKAYTWYLSYFDSHVFLFPPTKEQKKQYLKILIFHKIPKTSGWFNRYNWFYTVLVLTWGFYIIWNIQVSEIQEKLKYFWMDYI